MPNKNPRVRKTAQRGSFKDLKPLKSIIRSHHLFSDNIPLPIKFLYHRGVVKINFIYSEPEKKHLLSSLSANPEDRSMVHLQTSTAFKVLLSARFCAAIWSNISDCDETFNYWEPVRNT